MAQTNLVCTVYHMRADYKIVRYNSALGWTHLFLNNTSGNEPIGPNMAFVHPYYLRVIVKVRQVGMQPHSLHITSDGYFSLIS